MSSPNTSSSDEDEDLPSDVHQKKNKYTQEQKIVTAVWMHERHFNGQNLEDIRNNFQIRFKSAPPKSTTMTRWENRLFTEGLFSFDKSRAPRPTERLMHVPYVKASFREKPNISQAERARQLGISRETLRTIIKHELKESDLKPPLEENVSGDNIKEAHGNSSKNDDDNQD